MKKFWDLRYSQPEYAYGKEPNRYFEYILSNLKPGKILLPAEGEGRNAVFAAENGWKVTAVDFSSKARDKAQQYAVERNVTMNYLISDVEKYNFPENEYDAAALIYAHFPPQCRTNIHKSVIKSIKPGGTLIVEAFSKKQINNNTGGPREVNLLYDLKELLEDFKGMVIGVAAETDIELSEGIYHKGRADVIRILAKKHIKGTQSIIFTDFEKICFKV